MPVCRFARLICGYMAAFVTMFFAYEDGKDVGIPTLARGELDLAAGFDRQLSHFVSLIAVARRGTTFALEWQIDAF